MTEITIPANDAYKQTTASGGETNIPFDFPIFAKADLVLLRTRSGTTTTLVLDTDYTIADNQLEVQAGGNAVLAGAASPATAADVYTAYRAVSEARLTDYTQAGAFKAATINRDLDLVVMMAQQLRRDVDRKVGLAAETSGSGVSLNLPTPSASKLLRWNSGATALENYDIGGLSSVAIAAAMVPVVQAATLAAAKAVLDLEIGTDIPALQATEGVVGGSEIATLAEAIALDSTRIVPAEKIASWLGPLLEPGGRLTLTTATPVTTSNVSAATTVYYALYKHNFVPLWNGSNWGLHQIAELSLALTSNSGHTGYQQSGKNFDLFIYNDAGTIRLCTGPAWTNDTTRADAIARKDGRWTNNASIVLRFGNASGNTVTAAANTALYVGTMRASADGQTEDSQTKRFVWNTYNRVKRSLVKIESTGSWTYTTATIRQARATATNQVEFVCGLAEDAVHMSLQVRCSNGSAANVLAGIGLDSTTAIVTPAGSITFTSASGFLMGTCNYVATHSLGYHYLAWLEHSQAAGTTTWTGSDGTAGYMGLNGSMFG